MELLQTLADLTKLPEKKILHILNLFDTVNVPAKTTLLIPGSICPKIWLVSLGSLRAFYYQDERKRVQSGNKKERTSREVTDWIIPSGGVFTPIQSFTQQVPTSYYIETLQFSKLYSLSYQNYILLKKSQPEMVFNIYEHIINMYKVRLEICNLRYPEERLRMFEVTHQELIGHLPVHIQASYLNIEPNTLSKIRGKSS